MEVPLTTTVRTFEWTKERIGSSILAMILFVKIFAAASIEIEVYLYVLSTTLKVFDSIIFIILLALALVPLLAPFVEKLNKIVSTKMVAPLMLVVMVTLIVVRYIIYIAEFDGRLCALLIRDCAVMALLTVGGYWHTVLGGKLSFA